MQNVTLKPHTTAESDDGDASMRSLTFKDFLSKTNKVSENPDLKNKKKNFDF